MFVEKRREVTVFFRIMQIIFALRFENDTTLGVEESFMCEMAAYVRLNAAGYIAFIRLHTCCTWSRPYSKEWLSIHIHINSL